MSGQNFPYKTVRDVDVRNQNILMRVDYNVPIDKKTGEIADDFRIEKSIETIKFLLQRGAKLVLISHLGRPNGQKNAQLSLKKIAQNLSEKLGQKVKFIDDCIGDKVYLATKKMAAGDVVLLENLRFYAEEEKNDRDFAKSLAHDSHAKIFVQDGFGVVHRAHASTVGVTEFLPSVAGFLLEKEFSEITAAINDPNRPLTAILGGAKISDKIPLVKKFLKIADNVVIGGAMANNFLQYLGKNVGQSLVEDGENDVIREIFLVAKKKFGEKLPEKLILPRDVAIGREISDPRYEILVDNVSDDEKIFDLGTMTIDLICEKIRASGTVIWNGDLGLDATADWSHGSSRVALELAKNPQIISVVGGGDTADFVRHWDALRGGSFTHVSTGGGASLELMSGEKLPGITALMRK